jgi:Rieske Fe-S protein
MGRVLQGKESEMEEWTRRRFLKGTLVAGAAAVIAACTPKGGAPADSQGDESSEEADPVEALARSQGKVMELDGEEVAVYKDEEGDVVKLSPVCPHQGCTVGWNASEDTWDCPCHASRFEPDGSYISGPANEDLKPTS